MCNINVDLGCLSFLKLQTFNKAVYHRITVHIIIDAIRQVVNVKLSRVVSIFCKHTPFRRLEKTVNLVGEMPCILCLWVVG